MTVGAVMFLLGLMVKGCSGDRSSSTGSTAYYPQPGAYQPVTAASPPQVKLPVARDGSVIAHPENYVPKTVILQKPVKVGLFEGQKVTGTRTLPVGTEVKLKAIDGFKAYVEVDGRWEVIDASATDLLEQMTQAAGEVE